jgi:hypothetical protein
MRATAKSIMLGACAAVVLSLAVATGATANARCLDPAISPSQPRCLSRLWLARSNVATAREARAWPDTGAVQSAMELEARLPAHRTSLRSAPIRARKADGVGARGKGTQTTRSEGSNGLNRSSIYG